MGKGPFKMIGHELPGPNQKSPNKFWGAVIQKAQEKKEEIGEGATRAFASVKDSSKKAQENKSENTVKFSE
jgi:vacuolar-type H+-ATPase subunit E/Vma4